MSGVVKRAPNGHLLPGGRPRGAIEELRERLQPHMPEFAAALVELVRSPNEATRLAAIREAFDRLLGKAPIAVDQTVAKFDMGALYLEAVKAANSPIDVTPPAAVPADQINSTTDEW
jgi:hypothetical protein